MFKIVYMKNEKHTSVVCVCVCVYIYIKYITVACQALWLPKEKHL